MYNLTARHIYLLPYAGDVSNIDIRMINSWIVDSLVYCAWCGWERSENELTFPGAYCVPGVRSHFIKILWGKQHSPHFMDSNYNSNTKWVTHRQHNLSTKADSNPSLSGLYFKVIVFTLYHHFFMALGHEHLYNPSTMHIFINVRQKMSMASSHTRFAYNHFI